MTSKRCYKREDVSVCFRIALEVTHRSVKSNTPIYTHWLGPPITSLFANYKPKLLNRKLPHQKQTE